MSRKEPPPRVTYRRFYNHQYAAMGVAVLVLAASAFHGGAQGFVRTIPVLLLVMPCILFPEAMGSIVGPRFSTRPSHPGCLALVAWALLLVALAARIAAVLGLGIAS